MASSIAASGALRLIATPISTLLSSDVITVTTKRFHSTKHILSDTATKSSILSEDEVAVVAKKLVMALMKGDADTFDQLIPKEDTSADSPPATSDSPIGVPKRPLISVLEKAIHELLPWGTTPLHLAAEFGRTDAFIRMVTRGKGNTHVLSLDETTPLHTAVLTGELDIVEFIISERKKESLELSAEATSATPLLWPQSLINGPEANLIHCAAQMGDTDILELLVNERAVVDSVEPVTGMTPLQIAEACKFEVAAKYLRGVLKKEEARAIKLPAATDYL